MLCTRASVSPGTLSCRTELLLLSLFERRARVCARHVLLGMGKLVRDRRGTTRMVRAVLPNTMCRLLGPTAKSKSRETKGSSRRKGSLS